MSKYGFQELQTLYEGGYRGLAVDFNPDRDYTPTTDLKHSVTGKGQLPTNVPGSGGNAYSYGTTRMSFEDEDEVVVPINLIRKKINDLLQDATDRGMGFACSQLHDLIKFIDTLK